MSILSGLGARARGLFVDTKGPWGPNPGKGGDEPPSDGGGGGGPWGEPPKRGRRAPQPQSPNVASFEDFLRRSKARFGDGGGGRFSGGSGRSMIGWVILGVILLWLVFTSVHSVAPGQRGVVLRFGRYSHTLGPGVGLTLPSPIDRVSKIDVENVRTVDLGSAGGNDLMLTGDQNLIDIAYSVRWYIRTPELYLFELANPDETIGEVANSAMRSVISQVSLNEAMGDRRADIETQVTERMQQILDSYRSGIQIQGIAIKQADPPDQVNDAFKQVTAAQQDAQTYINNANAYALQLRQRAQGEATAFDKVYEQYKLAPEVTRRRMYFETM